VPPLKGGTFCFQGADVMNCQFLRISKSELWSSSDRANARKAAGSSLHRAADLVLLI
jgi:hypothetical protein